MRLLPPLTALCAAAFLAAALSAAEQKEQPAATAPAKADPAKEAAKAKTAPAAKQDSAQKAEGTTVQLPKFPVSASRLREIDITIRKLDKQITREKTLLEKTALDDTLNNEKISQAASIFGGKSSLQRESVAAVRVESMEKEKSLLETLRTPLTKEDRELIEKLIEDQRVYRRNLDDALR